MENTKDTKRKILIAFTFVLIHFYIFAMPFYAYAAVNEPGYTMSGYRVTANGVAKIAPYASRLLSRYFLARLAFSIGTGFAGAALLTLGTYAYDKYTQKKIEVPVSMTTPPVTEASPPASPEGSVIVNPWGSFLQGGSTQIIEHTEETYALVSDVCPVDSPAYGLYPSYRVKSNPVVSNFGSSVSSDNVVTGGRTIKISSNVSAVADCNLSPSGSFANLSLPQQSWCGAPSTLGECLTGNESACGGGMSGLWVNVKKSFGSGTNCSTAAGQWYYENEASIPADKFVCKITYNGCWGSPSNYCVAWGHLCNKPVVESAPVMSTKVEVYTYPVSSLEPSSSTVPIDRPQTYKAEDFQNTESMVKTIQLAQNSIDAIGEKIKASMPAGSPATNIQPMLDKLKADLTEPLEKGYIDAKEGEDFEADEGKILPLESEPSPIGSPSDSPPSSDPENPPPISDGVCGDYQYRNNWDSIKTSIESALQNLPILALVGKLNTLSGGDGMPRTISLDLSSVGLGEHTIDLDKYMFAEVLAVLRWAVIAGGFFYAWKIAVGGD